MRIERIDPRYLLNPNQSYWIYSEEDLDSLIAQIERGNSAQARRIVRERKIPLGWQSNK